MRLAHNVAGKGKILVVRVEQTIMSNAAAGRVFCTQHLYSLMLQLALSGSCINDPVMLAICLCLEPFCASMCGVCCSAIPLCCIVLPHLTATMASVAHFASCASNSRAVHVSIVSGSCFVLPLEATLCHAVPHFAMLCHAGLYVAMLPSAMLCCTMLPSTTL